LEVADPAEKNSVMEEIVPAIKELQNDVFGNYVVQKLYEFGTDEMKVGLKGTLEGNMLLLSLQMYGCRVVQKALESLAYDDLCELLREFDSYVLTCIQDQNGNHVMQKIVEVMSRKAKEAEARSREPGLSDAMADRIQFVVDDVLANARTLCCHPYGCRVLQRMLEHCVERQRTATLDAICLCHEALLDDQYGNYVIQHVLQYGRESDRDSLLRIIVANDLLKLSRQKFASNVVEKLLKYGNSNQRNAIVREMLKVVNEGTSQEGVGSSVLLLMVRDAYANYVVQTAIDVVPEGNEKRMLLDELKANEVQLRNYTFAKHIVAKLGSK
jgi:pumilio RNA-binding family